MQHPTDPLGTDRLFFASLLGRQMDALERLLADDFVLIDVMTGSEIPKAAFLAVLQGDQLEFHAIELVDSRVRLYGSTAVITGHTEMRGTFAGTSFETQSRYTHVYVEQQQQWRMVAAQGTRIVEMPGMPAG